MKSDPLPRLDQNPSLREELLEQCRLGPGEIWIDDGSGHRVGCLDATNPADIDRLTGGEVAHLAVQDPPYNLAVFEERSVEEYIDWCRKWLANTTTNLAPDASLYIWLGADQRDGFQPFADFVILMRELEEWQSRSFITMRNQRGYGTQGNWMAVRQELIFYTRGNPDFEVQYTDIPKVLRGYYKEVAGEKKENLQRSRSQNIRASNVWVDVQQVFYRMEENVSGCYAQKPLKAIDRIILASSEQGETVLDSFAHAGTTLLSCERLGRRCFTADIDPVYCEMAIRRLEYFRVSGRTGWQNRNPFANEKAETQSTLFASS